MRREIQNPQVFHQHVKNSLSPERCTLESHLVSQIKAKDPQFCSRHMKCFGDVEN
jgi:hypothetical protein